MKSLGPSAIDVEIRSLGPDLGGSVEVLGEFLRFCQAVLETNKDFELIQAYLGLFLKVRESFLLMIVLPSSTEGPKHLESLPILFRFHPGTIQLIITQWMGNKLQ